MRKKEIMEGLSGEGSGRRGRSGRFRITFYSAAVLLVLLILGLNMGKDQTAFLFDKNSPITIYVKTETGVKPDVDTALYFPEKVDISKFSYDWEKGDLSTAGTYSIPVLYDGKQTVCTISLEVRSEEGMGETSTKAQEEDGDGTWLRGDEAAFAGEETGPEASAGEDGLEKSNLTKGEQK